MTVDLSNGPSRPNRLASLKGFSAFYGYRLAVYSFAMGFLASSFFLHSRGIFFPVWMAEFAADKTQISFVISLVLFTGSITAPVFGYCLDRFPWRKPS